MGKVLNPFSSLQHGNVKKCHHCHCEDGDNADETSKYNKYKKGVRIFSIRRSETKLQIAFLGVILVIIVFIYRLIETRKDDKYEAAWDRFYRAKNLLRMRNPSWPRPLGSTLGVVSSPVDQKQVQAVESPKTNMSTNDLVALFDSIRPKDSSRRVTYDQKQALYPILREWLLRLNQDIRFNTKGGIRWIRPYLLPPLPTTHGTELVPSPGYRHEEEPTILYATSSEAGQVWNWQTEWNHMLQENKVQGPPVDYTQPQLYKYPPLLEEPPPQGGYPATTTLQNLLQEWPQNQDILPGTTIQETLLHFDYSNATQLAMALKFRNALLPFKLYNIPDIQRVSQLWTDEYLAEQFDQASFSFRFRQQADGLCQESPNHFFAFFVPQFWQTTTMGLPPVRNNDMTFQQWSQHAKYADAKPLDPDQPHFYWQSGTSKDERFAAKQSFISSDLNSTLSCAQNNFFVFNMSEQKGIQCRFGERGVTAATHFDSGQNMIAMFTGAKRYILSPPKACSQLGVFSSRKSPIFRHSLLNFDHFHYLHNDTITDNYGHPMSTEEQKWLLRAAQAPALETVLKQGEVLFLPSFWFHYIVSLQKSAQCNVRSGIDMVGTPEFGNAQDISNCGSAKDRGSSPFGVQ